MTLTPQNMESKEDLLSHSIFRDIARMDEEQLGRYVRAAFTGHRDIAFLPEPFWDYWFDMETHGRSEDGRTAPSPAVFLAGIHDMIDSVARGTFRVGAEGEEPPDFSYRAKFRKVLDDILDKCISIDSTPTEEQKRLASFAVEAAGSFQSVESFNAGGKERSSQYPQELSEDLEILEEERAKLLHKASELINGGRFGDLKLRY